MADTVLQRAAIDSATSFTGDTDLINSLAHLDELCHQPHDKRDYSWTGNTGTENWVNAEAVVNAYSRKVKLVLVYSAGAGSADIVHVQKSGANANIVKTDAVTLATGLNLFAVDSTGVTFSSETYIGVKPSTSSLLKYKVTTPFSAFNFASSGSAFSTTTGFEIGYWVGYHPREFLPRVVEGIPAAEFDLAEALAQLDDVRLPAGDVTLSSTVSMPNTKTIRGIRGKSRVIIPSGSTGIDCQNSREITLRDFSVVGSLSDVDITDDTDLATDAHVESLNGMGAERGIYVRGATANDVLIDGVIVENVDGVGIDVSDTTSSTAANSQGVTFTNIVAKNNYLGMRFADTGEYSCVTNYRAYANLIGLRVDGGNNYFTGGNLAYNRVGLVLGTGSNDSHGSINCVSFNHCELYGIYGYDFDWGFLLTGCHCWFSDIKVDNSKGFHWSNGMLSNATVTINDCPSAQLLETIERSFVTIQRTGTTRLEERGRRTLDENAIKEPFVRIS